MANRDTRRALKRKKARKATKRGAVRTGDTIPQEWDFTEYDAAERAEIEAAEHELQERMG